MVGECDPGRQKAVHRHRRGQRVGTVSTLVGGKVGGSGVGEVTREVHDIQQRRATSGRDWAGWVC